LADCTPRERQESEMFWKQSIHQESNPVQKLKTLESAYQKCPLDKVAIDRYITYVFTLSKSDRKNPEIIESLHQVELKNQNLDVPIEHINNNQKKINTLLGRSMEGTLKAVEEVGGVYRADIRFDYNSAVLKKSRIVTNIIDKIMSEIEQHPNAIFGLEGGASSEGSADYNKKLSKRRAEALKSAITNSNPNLSSHINTYANGETTLVCEGGFAPEVDSSGNARCITKEDKEASRRVTIRRER